MFSNEELKALIRGEMIGEVYPYSNKNEIEVTNYLKAIAAELKRDNIKLYEEPAHFGSGYASYVQWFCYEEKHIEISENESTRTEKIDGLAVAISCLAPGVLIGQMWKTSTYLRESDKYFNGGQTFISEPTHLAIAPAHQLFANKLERLFMKYHYTILRHEDVARPLLIEADIPTIIRDKGQYLVWDAIFYWHD